MLRTLVTVVTLLVNYKTNDDYVVTDVVTTLKNHEHLRQVSSQSSYFQCSQTQLFLSFCVLRVWKSSNQFSGFFYLHMPKFVRCLHEALCLFSCANLCFRHGVSHTETNILTDPQLSFAASYKQYTEQLKELFPGWLIHYELLCFLHCVKYCRLHSSQSLLLHV